MARIITTVMPFLRPQDASAIIDYTRLYQKLQMVTGNLSDGPPNRPSKFVGNSSLAPPERPKVCGGEHRI
jgi:hypothetical protein